MRAFHVTFGSFYGRRGVCTNTRVYSVYGMHARRLYCMKTYTLYCVRRSYFPIFIIFPCSTAGSLYTALSVQALRVSSYRNVFPCLHLWLLAPNSTVSGPQLLTLCERKFFIIFLLEANSEINFLLLSVLFACCLNPGLCNSSPPQSRLLDYYPRWPCIPDLSPSSSMADYSSLFHLIYINLGCGISWLFYRQWQMTMLELRVGTQPVLFYQPHFCYSFSSVWKSNIDSSLLQFQHFSQCEINWTHKR